MLFRSDNIPDLFVRNDRILVEMESDKGRLIVAMVGATNVGRITVGFCPELVGNSGSGLRDWKPKSPLRLRKGDDLGCFEMGSTVVLVLDARWAARLRQEYATGASIPIRVGMELSD